MTSSRRCRFICNYIVEVLEKGIRNAQRRRTAYKQELEAVRFVKSLSAQLRYAPLMFEIDGQQPCKERLTSDMYVDKKRIDIPAAARGAEMSRSLIPLASSSCPSTCRAIQVSSDTSRPEALSCLTASTPSELPASNLSDRKTLSTSSASAKIESSTALSVRLKNGSALVVWNGKTSRSACINLCECLPLCLHCSLSLIVASDHPLLLAQSTDIPCSAE